MKETFYFSHDYNTRNDVKIKKLIAKHGYIAYGLFWALIEELYNNENSLPLDYELLSYDLRADDELLKSILNDFDLFYNDGNFFGSNSVKKRLEKRKEKSEKAKRSVEKRWNKYNKNQPDNTNVLQEDEKRNTIKERKGKESKIKESKIKENKVKENKVKLSGEKILLEKFNSINVIQHKNFTQKMKKAFQKAKKLYSLDEIYTAIERYGIIYNDKTNSHAKEFGKYKWTLDELLSREKGISEFLDEGGKWIRYNQAKENEVKNTTLNRVEMNWTKEELEEYEKMQLGKPLSIETIRKGVKV